MERLTQLVNQNADLLNQYSVFIVVLAILPLALLAWGLKVYPHYSQIAVLFIPAILTFALLIDRRLLGVVLLVDLIIPLLVLIDLFTLPSRKSLTIERQALKIASLQKLHRVTLHISNVSAGSFTV